MSKKKSAFIIVALIVVLVAIAVSILQQNSSIEKQISTLKEAHCTVSDGIKVYERSPSMTTKSAFILNRR